VPKRKVRYPKLVRDKVPKRIRKNGEVPIVVTLEVAEFKVAIFKKLVEEAGEARDAKTHRELIEEVGDIEDVLDEVYKLNHLKRKQVRHARKKKHATHGGFKVRLSLLGVKKKR